MRMTTQHTRTHGHTDTHTHTWAVALSRCHFCAWSTPVCQEASAPQPSITPEEVMERHLGDEGRVRMCVSMCVSMCVYMCVSMCVRARQRTCLARNFSLQLWYGQKYGTYSTTWWNRIVMHVHIVMCSVAILQYIVSQKDVLLIFFQGFHILHCVGERELSQREKRKEMKARTTKNCWPAYLHPHPRCQFKNIFP